MKLKYIFSQTIRVLRYLISKKELNMRQERWVAFIKAYECIIAYYCMKANMIIDAFSRKNKVVIDGLLVRDKEELLKNYGLSTIHDEKRSFTG